MRTDIGADWVVGWMSFTRQPPINSVELVQVCNYIRRRALLRGVEVNAFPW